MEETLSNSLGCGGKFGFTLWVLTAPGSPSRSITSGTINWFNEVLDLFDASRAGERAGGQADGRVGGRMHPCGLSDDACPVTLAN